MSTLRHHPQHLRLLIITEADGADAIGPAAHRLVLGEGEFRVGIDHSLVEADDAAVIVAIWAGGGVVLGNENDLGENDAGIGAGGSGGGAGVEAAGAGGAAADVECEEEGGEEDEEGEGYGDGVAEADPGEGVVGGRGGGH